MVSVNSAWDCGCKIKYMEPHRLAALPFQRDPHDVGQGFRSRSISSSRDAVGADLPPAAPQACTLHLEPHGEPLHQCALDATLCSGIRRRRVGPGNDVGKRWNAARVVFGEGMDGIGTGSIAGSRGFGLCLLSRSSSLPSTSLSSSSAPGGMYGVSSAITKLSRQADGFGFRNRGHGRSESGSCRLAVRIFGADDFHQPLETAQERGGLIAQVDQHLIVDQRIRDVIEDDGCDRREFVIAATVRKEAGGRRGPDNLLSARSVPVRREQHDPHVARQRLDRQRAGRLQLVVCVGVEQDFGHF